MTLEAFGTVLRERLDAGLGSRLVTLVGTSGPAYARPGAMLLLAAPDECTPDAAVLAGYLSGGCLEEEVAARSVGVSPAEPVLRMSIDTSDEGPFGLGLACGGTLDLLIEWVEGASEGSSSLRSWAQAIAAGRPARRWVTPSGTRAWWTQDDGTATKVVQGIEPAHPLTGSHVTAWHERSWDALVPDVHARLTAGPDGWLHEVPAPPTLRIVGTEHEAGVVAETMRLHGWDVEVIAPSRARLETLHTRVFERTGLEVRTVVADAEGITTLTVGSEDRILAASHRLDLDVAAVRLAQRHGVRWLGVIGSARREAALRSALAEVTRDAPDETGAAWPVRLEMPAGLDVGARGPQEIATAIAGRLTADLRDAARPTWVVIPAAGAASRMGFAKALLHDGHETLLARAQRLAWRVADGVVVVTGARREEIASELAAGTREVRVEDWQAGMRASLYAGMAATPLGARVLVVLPDMPGVNGAHLERLVQASRHAAGAVSVYPDGRVGVPALLPDDLVAEVRRDPSRSVGDVGFGPWLQGRRDLARIPLEDARDLDDAAAARAAGWWPAPLPS